MAGKNGDGAEPAKDIDIDALVRAGAEDDVDDEGADGADRGDEVIDGAKDDGKDDVKDEAKDDGKDEGKGGAKADVKDDVTDEGNGDEHAAEDDAEDGDDAKDDGKSEGDEPREEKPRSKMIPRERFDEVNGKLKQERAARLALEAKLAAGKGDEGKQPPADPDGELKAKLAEVEDKYEEALLDGDKEKAKQYRAERRQIEEQIVDRKATRAAQDARKAVPEDVKLQAAVEELSTKYPTLNNEHEDFDPEITGEVLDLADTFKARGMAPSAALRKAVDYVVKAVGLKAVDEVDGAEDDEPVTPAKEKPQPTAAQRKAKIAAAKQQPPQGVARGKEEPAAPTLDDLSEDEFDALPESKKRVLRGDAI